MLTKTAITKYTMIIENKELLKLMVTPVSKSVEVFEINCSCGIAYNMGYIM